MKTYTMSICYLFHSEFDTLSKYKKAMMPYSEHTKSRYKIFTLFFMACIFTIFLSSSCAAESADNPQKTGGVYYFPVQRSGPQPGPAVSSMLLLQGKLVMDDGYISAVDLRTGERQVVIWPYGYSLDISHQTAQIMDGKGRLVAQVGDNVQGSSGYGIDFDIHDLRTGQNLSADLIKDKKPFWDATPIEFFPFFPVYNPFELETDSFNSRAEGTLVLERGYVRLYTASGASYLPIWPLAYKIRKNEGQLVVAGKDTTGKFYFEGIPGNIFIGDKVSIRGAEATAGTLKKYILYSIPEEREGPFWIVTEIKSTE
jgi:hypothetical protein